MGNRETIERTGAHAVGGELATGNGFASDSLTVRAIVHYNINGYATGLRQKQLHEWSFLPQTHAQLFTF